MTPNDLQKIGSEILDGNVIAYFSKLEDTEYPEVLWSIYGLVKTNEIAVVVEANGKKFAEIAPSNVTLPPMIERQPDISLTDNQLSQLMSEKLWDTYKEVLISK